MPDMRGIIYIINWGCNVKILHVRKYSN
jgi:hypothetical protein